MTYIIKCICNCEEYPRQIEIEVEHYDYYRTILELEAEGWQPKTESRGLDIVYLCPKHKQNPHSFV